MIDFSTLRSNRGKQGEALKRAFEKTGGGGFKADPRIWKYTRDEKTNISSNIIRFLPIAKVDYESVQAGTFKEEDLTPVIQVLALRFEGKNGWFVGNTRATFGEACPVREWTAPQWKAIKNLNKDDPSVKAEREYLKKMIPKTEYYAGILVVNDAQVPENNGKVFLFQFGEAVRKMLDLAENPKFPNQPKIDPYDPWVGANLLLDLSFEKRAFGGKESWVPKFDAVRWDAPSPMGDDAFIESVWAQQHSLLEFHKTERFLTYEESKAKLMKVQNLDENLNPIVGGASSTIGRSVSDYGSAQSVQAPAPAPSAPAQVAQQHLTETQTVAVQAPADTVAAPAAAPAQAVQAEDPIMARLRAMTQGK